MSDVIDLSQVKVGKMANELQLSVKLSRWRMNDDNPDTELSSAQYIRNRTNRMETVGYSCQFCGIRTQRSPDAAPSSRLSTGYLEAHHMDDDHTNNSPSNLVPACPFCHSVFHIGYAGRKKGSVLIWLPDMSQAHFNILCHAMLAAMMNDETADEARKVYTSLRGLSFRVDDIFNLPGGSASAPAVMGKALALLDKETYLNRGSLLQPLRLMPDLDRYTDEGQYWLDTTWRNNPPSKWSSLP